VLAGATGLGTAAGGGRGRGWAGAGAGEGRGGGAASGGGRAEALPGRARGDGPASGGGRFEADGPGGPPHEPPPGTARQEPQPPGRSAGKLPSAPPGQGRSSEAASVEPGRAPTPRTPAAPRHPAKDTPRTPHTLRAQNLHVAYDGYAALAGVSLDVPPGRVTAVVGPNGAGKSTLFHCLAGTVRPVRGRVVFGEREITGLPAHARTRLGIARTFQQLAVFPSLTVAENVRVGAEQGHVRDPAAVERALRLLGLDGPVRARPAAGLPTGTLRRVELARALAGGPRVLLLDEPAAGLDTAEVRALSRVLRALAADGMALLVVEHDLDLVAHLADTVHVLTAGRIVTSGPADQVLESA